MTEDPAVLAYAKKVAEEIELLSRILAPRLRAIREHSNAEEELPLAA